ncbi:cell division inhibitor SepF [Lactobacillus bombicola]|uniref:Cell division protein SepF n=1 Tax=Lactobacillus bombicola TaxID=1505723 RepID=A0A1I1RAY7_9LACO|nr:MULTISPECIES: cell division protein SepF [Lactobacillus]MCO6528295.1 cell division protein SepF [Lactobacillus sp.]RHW54541.1 DUF552 domain-containing protein [Lactobacillus bombicola]RMC39858.1 DUF552 domain-containing protein [Lactobacillus sp. ESL0237]RMC41346.1 DUF552 domain-containing protein [Lactobacillus sp. ESL0233]RMC44017.1 DUF552 domain-containing protein [Lactobacillus sp. ESL0234]
MSFSKLGKFFGVTDIDDEIQDDEEYEDTLRPDDNSASNGVYHDNVVSINSSASGHKKSKIVLYEPRVYSDAKEVAQNLLDNKAVIINFSRMEDASAKRIVDFITGTVYALNGKIQRVGDKIFLATPPRFVTDGKISELVDKKDNLE